MNVIEEAKQFAHEAHDAINQKRKYNGLPYWVHTDEVARIVSETPGTTPSMVAAAHLHDVLEDVAPVCGYFNLDLIKRKFGSEVALYVIELTDVYTKAAYPKLNRAARHKLENERLEKISPQAKTIKLADLISNTESIVNEDPDFARVYLREKLDVLPMLADGSPVLLQRASEQTIRGLEKIGMPMTVVTS